MLLRAAFDHRAIGRLTLDSQPTPCSFSLTSPGLTSFFMKNHKKNYAYIIQQPLQQFRDPDLTSLQTTSVSGYSLPQGFLWWEWRRKEFVISDVLSWAAATPSKLAVWQMCIRVYLTNALALYRGQIITLSNAARSLSLFRVLFSHWKVFGHLCRICVFLWSGQSSQL